MGSNKKHRGKGSTQARTNQNVAAPPQAKPIEALPVGAFPSDDPDRSDAPLSEPKSAVKHKTTAPAVVTGVDTTNGESPADSGMWSKLQAAGEWFNAQKWVHLILFIGAAIWAYTGIRQEVNRIPDLNALEARKLETKISEFQAKKGSEIDELRVGVKADIAEFLRTKAAELDERGLKAQASLHSQLKAIDLWTRMHSRACTGPTHQTLPGLLRWREFGQW